MFLGDKHLKEFKLYQHIVSLIDYSEKYILSSFNKTEITLKINFTNALYDLLENLIRANINTGNIRNKYQKEILVNSAFLDYYIEKIKTKNIIINKRYISFINKLDNINKLTYGWINSEESK